MIDDVELDELVDTVRFLRKLVEQLAVRMEKVERQLREDLGVLDDEDDD